jgi:hypothetical protein
MLEGIATDVGQIIEDQGVAILVDKVVVENLLPYRGQIAGRIILRPTGVGLPPIAAEKAIHAGMENAEAPIIVIDQCRPVFCCLKRGPLRFAVFGGLLGDFPKWGLREGLLTIVGEQAMEFANGVDRWQFLVHRRILFLVLP